jgi:hypothetical protein
MDKHTKIMSRLQENYDKVISMGYTIVGIFLQGSQNYELDYEGSDIDCKAIILPKFQDIVLNSKPISTTIVLENNEHIDLKDIRLMFDCFKKQNINFVEILFTKYKIINPEFEKLIQPIFNNREEIAHYNNYASVNCMSGTSMEKYKALEHPYPSLIEKIEKFGYDGKQLSHMLRIEEFMIRYINGELYENCLISKQKDYLIRVKLNQEYSLEEARKVASEANKRILDMKNNYIQNHKVEINENVNLLLNNVLVNIIKENLKSELELKEIESK